MNVPIKSVNFPQAGAVTFLDVLGWKGVYDRQENAIDRLTGTG